MHNILYKGTGSKKTDYQNHLNDGLYTISKADLSIALPSYANTTTYIPSSLLFVALFGLEVEDEESLIVEEELPSFVSFEDFLDVFGRDDPISDFYFILFYFILLLFFFFSFFFFLFFFVLLNFVLLNFVLVNFVLFCFILFYLISLNFLKCF